MSSELYIVRKTKIQAEHVFGAIQYFLKEFQIRKILNNFPTIDNSESICFYLPSHVPIHFKQMWTSSLH